MNGPYDIIPLDGYGDDLESGVGEYALGSHHRPAFVRLYVHLELK